MNLRLIKAAFIKSLPVMAGYIVLGMGFGILLRMSGYGLHWAIIMSIFIFAGSLQYVGVSLIASGTPLLSIAITSFMVNVRHVFYGISMLHRYKGAGIKKLYLMHALTDETYSLICTSKVPEGLNEHNYYFFISLFNHIYWIIGGILGSILGAVLPFDLSGVEFSMTALFVTVFVEQWLTTKEHRPALLGMGISFVCLIIFKSENFLIPSMILIMLALMIMRKFIEKGEKHEH